MKNKQPTTPEKSTNTTCTDTAIHATENCLRMLGNALSCWIGEMFNPDNPYNQYRNDPTRPRFP